MSCELEILRQEIGRFDRRLPVGPAIWPHYDLLWIHEGSIELTAGRPANAIRLTAPDGILLAPDVPFAGRARSAIAIASVCHFRSATPCFSELFRQPSTQAVYQLQNMLHLSLRYARQKADMEKRRRLLAAIIDCFEVEAAPENGDPRLRTAWRFAQEHLAEIRTLDDVAATIGLRESSFRSLHRASHQMPAGRYLTALRLDQAERLLATSGETIAEIARAVGYCHPESLSQAFLRHRGQSPAAYRNSCKRFA